MAEQSSSQIPPDLPALPFERVNEFPDRLSPMLVKELRQGMRTSSFVILFVLLQAILTIVLLIASLLGLSDITSDTSSAGRFVTGFILVIYSLGVLVFQPLRGISAIATEVRENTIDLMTLTSLTAWRIVFGKWLSIVSQSALIAGTVLPYLIISYFFGGMQMFPELTLWLALFVVSGALTAITVGISAVGNAIVRGLLVVGGSALIMGCLLFTFIPHIPHLIEMLAFTRGDQTLSVIAFLVAACYICYFFLELGTTAIAPSSENRATRKRLIGLGVLALCYLLLRPTGESIALFTALGITGCIALDLFSERANFPPIVCQKFLRLGVLGRIAGRFLYPGWGTGSLFFLALTVVLCMLIYLTNSNLRGYTVALLGIGTLAFPAVIIQVFARNSTNRFSSYFFILLATLILSRILGFLYENLSGELLLWIFSFIPAVLLPLASQSASTAEPLPLLFAAIGITSLYFLVILTRSLPQLGHISTLESEAQRDLDDSLLGSTDSER